MEPASVALCGESIIADVTKWPSGLPILWWVALHPHTYWQHWVEFSGLWRKNPCQVGSVEQDGEMERLGREGIGACLGKHIAYTCEISVKILRWIFQENLKLNDKHSCKEKKEREDKGRGEEGRGRER